MKMIYKICFCVLSWFVMTSASGQTSVVVTVLIPPPYSPYLQDYLQYENKMVIQLQNLTSQSLSIKLIASMEGDNGILITTNEDYLPVTPIILSPNGFIRVPASNSSRGFFDPDHVSFNGDDDLKKQILKDGILPEGNYMVCLQALEYTTGTPLSAEAPAGCTLLSIQYPTPPQLLSPECEQNVEGDHPFFQWTLPGGNTGASSLLYDIYIVEYLEGSNPQDLMALAVDYNAGNAIIRKNLTVPSYQYQVTDPKLKKGTVYLWATKVHDQFSRLNFENDGLSEICLFNYNLPVDDGVTLGTGLHSDHPFHFQQNRTRIMGNIKYKFPGETNALANLVPRHSLLQTEDLPYQIAGEQYGQLGIFDESVLALANHDYIDAFPVSSIGANPLRHMEVKLIESWVITDCDVTYTDEDGGTRTAHKEFFILPNDFKTPGVVEGGTTITVTVDGVTNGEGENPLTLGSAGIGCNAYSRTLAVDHTDGNGNYQFTFTQSSPGLKLSLYQGHASVYMECTPGETETEENPFVNPYDEVSNPTEQYFDPSVVINTNQGQQNLLGNPNQNTVLRQAHLNDNPNQLPYKNVEINGGSLYKVLRLEVASPFYYSPDLIFWTQPGDTVTLPDQVSYVKSVEVNMQVSGGLWQQQYNYQILTEGLPVSEVDLLCSRLKDGLPDAIPMEEGQGLRSYEGEDDNGLVNMNGLHMVETDGYMSPGLYDSVSVMTSGDDGSMVFKRLVAGHPYYLKGHTPESGNRNYSVPLQSRFYNIIDPLYCQMHLEANLNSFSNHKAIMIKDEITAYPELPRVFGRIVTSTENNLGPLENAEIKLRQYINGNLEHTFTKHTNAYGEFHYDELPVNPNLTNDYQWRIYFLHDGYTDVMVPDNGNLITLKPGEQWDLNDREMVPLGFITGFVHDEEGRPIQALIKLVNGPHVQTDLVSPPVGEVEFCGDVNNLGDAIDVSTRINTGFTQAQNPIGEAVIQQAAQFDLPAQSGNNLRLVIIPLPEQYFMDTCIVDIENVPHGQHQKLGFITVKEKLHRMMFSIKGPEGNAVQAKVYIDEYVRQTNELSWTAFRFASPETSYRVRVVPELASYVPVDTVMNIPISKTYLQHTFRLKAGKAIQIKVVRDQTGQEYQSDNPIPIPGAVVQTLLTSSPTGDSYIQCITNEFGVCILEGVPTSLPTVDVSVWKEDDDNMYIGKTVAVSTSRPFTPPFTIALKVMAGVSIPDIWGFPAAITGLEIKTISGGGKDTLLEGIITSVPENTRFKSREENIQLPFPKTKFKFQGRRDDHGKKILEPDAAGLTLQQLGMEAVLFNKFDMLVKPKRFQDYQPLDHLYLQKISSTKGKISGVVETELSSFNTSYDYTGKFYLGETPTMYNIDVFQSQEPLFGNLITAELQVMGQEPAPGPDDFYLLDIGPQNKPRSYSFRVFQFDATSDSSRSFVNSNAFYVHTILHTDIEGVVPRDLQLSVGKIVITTDDIETFNNGINKLDFKMGTLWKYYSTTPYHYDYNVGGITAAHGIVNTGQIDVPIQNVIIQPKKLFMNDISEINQLSLAGIKSLAVTPGVNIVLSKEYNAGWLLSVRKLEDGVFDPDGIVAKLYGLDILRNSDTIFIQTIRLSSEDPDMDVNVEGDVRPYDIADFYVNAISTGQGYFSLHGPAELGRDGVRVPGMQPSSMLIQYTKTGNSVVGKIMSPFTGEFETKGGVSFTLEPSTNSIVKQTFSNRKFLSTGNIKVYEGANSFQLKGILELDYNDVRIHIIDKDLNVSNVLQYSHEDQAIYIGSNGKQLLVRKGVQECSNNTWEYLAFDANLVGFNGLKANQPPMPFVVTGSMETADAHLKVDGIEMEGLDLGFAAIKMTFDFAAQSFTGYMDFNPPGSVFLGPVTVEQIEAEILVDPNGFLFCASVDGSILGLFDTTLGLLLGSHTDVPKSFINLTLQYAKNKKIPPGLTDHELNGFFLTGRVDLVNLDLGSFNAVFFSYAGAVEAGIDARFYMDFGSNGNVTFDFAALAFAGAIVEATLISPCPEIISVVCISATLSLLIEGSVHKTGGQWEVTGSGCGAMSFSASFCGFSESISGWAKLEFSSSNGVDVDAGFGDKCTGGDKGEFVCDQNQ